LSENEILNFIKNSKKNPGTWEIYTHFFEKDKQFIPNALKLYANLFRLERKDLISFDPKHQVWIYTGKSNSGQKSEFGGREI